MLDIFSNIVYICTDNYLLTFKNLKMENELKDKIDHELSVKIKTPAGDWDTTLKKTAKIQDVINEVVTHFSFAQNGKYELVLEAKPGDPLKPERTLVSYGINDGDILVFIDFGAAV